MITFVTGFLCGDVSKHPPSRYLEWFYHIANTNIPIVLFLDPASGWTSFPPNVVVVPLRLEDTWVGQNVPLDVILPQTRGINTREYMLIQNAKTEIVFRALQLNPFHTEWFAWIDFGLYHVFKTPEQTLARIRSLLPPEKPCIRTAGIHASLAQDIRTDICWRYAGGFFLAHASKIQVFHEKVLATVQKNLPHLTWEVNTWAELERDGLQLGWFLGSHDDTIIPFSERHPTNSTYMFYLRENSLNTADPVFQTLRKDCMVFPDDITVARDFAMSGTYEQNLIAWAATMIDPSKIFVDIGAHVGTYSLYIAKRCAGVHSFECSPKTFNYLCANIAMSELDYQITPHRTALGDKVDTISYYLHSPDGGGNSCLPFTGRDSKAIQVPVTTLDSFQLDNIGLIKIDVEGFEQNVLQGGLETLKRSGYPNILFESWRAGREAEGIPSKALRENLFAFIESIGYRIIPVRGWDEMFIAEYTTPTSPA